MGLTRIGLFNLVVDCNSVSEVINDLQSDQQYKRWRQTQSNSTQKKGSKYIHINRKRIYVKTNSRCTFTFVNHAFGNWQK